MDNKKTNLTPELKEIYDRVMNTTTPPKAAPAPLPIQPSISPVTPPVPASTPTPLTTPPTAAAPIMPSMPASSSLGEPALPTSLNEPTPAEDALSSAPARPVSEIDNKAFSFSGTAPTPPPVPQTDKPVGKKESKISLPVLIVIGIVFLVVWGVFWAIIFGFVKR